MKSAKVEELTCIESWIVERDRRVACHAEVLCLQIALNLVRADAFGLGILGSRDERLSDLAGIGWRECMENRALHLRDFLPQGDL